VGPAPLCRIRHSPAASGAAMVLFLVVSALWLAAAGSARVWDHSTPGCFRPGCLPPQSYAGLHVSQWLGITGAALTVASFVLVARRTARAERAAMTARQVRRAVGGHDRPQRNGAQMLPQVPSAGGSTVAGTRA